MLKKTIVRYDNFKGEDRRLDPAQLKDASPYSLNFEPCDKGTALRTRGGFDNVAKSALHTEADTSLAPALNYHWLQDYGIRGNVFSVVAGLDRAHGIGLAQHIFLTGSEAGSAEARSGAVYPTDTDNIYWPAGSLDPDGKPEQVCDHATMKSAFGRLLVFMDRQMPMQIVTGACYTIGIDKPVSPTAGTGSAYEHKFTLIRNDEPRGMFSESPLTDVAVLSGSLPSLSAYTISAGQHPSAGITHVGVYRRKTDANDTWADFLKVEEVALATFESSGFNSASISDDTVKAAGTAADERKVVYRGFKFAHWHNSRLYVGGMRPWQGIAEVTNGSASVILHAVSDESTDSLSRYSDFIGLDDVRTISIGGVSRKIWRIARDEGTGVNTLTLANDDLSGPAVWAGATNDNATCEIAGDTRAVFPSYLNELGLEYNNLFYKIRPGTDAEGDLTGIGTLPGGELLLCYEGSLWGVSGGPASDTGANMESSGEWWPRQISGGVGLTAPKTLAYDEKGTLYGFGGPAVGVWRCAGLGVDSISNDALLDRLAEFGTAQDAVGIMLPGTRFYRLVLPSSDDQHFFDINLDSGAWSEGNHCPATCAMTFQPVSYGSATESASEVPEIPQGEAETFMLAVNAVEEVAE